LKLHSVILVSLALLAMTGSTQHTAAFPSSQSAQFANIVKIDNRTLMQKYSFLAEFHSGRGVGQSGNYLYTRVMRFANILDNGELEPVGKRISDNEGSIDWTSLTSLLQKIITRDSRIPILGLWICNFENLTEPGTRAFLTRLSNLLTDLNGTLIWIPAWEFNQHADWGHPEWNWGLGIAGSPREWYIKADTYVEKMTMIRNTRDSLGIRNILIGSQPDSLFRNTYPNWNGEKDPYPLTGQRVLMHYREGINQADVIGCSMYVCLYVRGVCTDVALTNKTYIEAAFDWMHKIHDYVGPDKPFFACEYNSMDVGGSTNANTFFIENSYGQIPVNFDWGFRALSWWVPFNSSEAWTTCKYWAGQYDGWTP